ncbi:MAG: tRNA dihydrouridine synthase DusB [Coriobacteriia bacterium]|nr:tRNA dihydrouridine synthase DusB [Coriobacteriia bacterium]
MLFDGRKVILAPMAGVTDEVCRELCIQQGAQLTYTEMVSAKALSYKNEKTQDLMRLSPAEEQVSVQIFGHEPETMAAQAATIEDVMGERLFAIDVNMGCPARKIAGKGDGSALMRNPELAADIVRKLKSAVKHPVTVKFRRGYELDNETAIDFARRMEDAGADAVAVHGRFAQQFYRGQADWGIIARVKEAIAIPVVGNGDICSGADAVRMVEETGCDAVMIGRGAQGNPWIFADVRSQLEHGVPAPAPSIEERMALAKRHAWLLSERSGRNIVRMRKHAMWYVAGLRGAPMIRGKINQASTYEEFASLFDELLELNR